MAAFPPLEPEERSYSLASYPVAVQSAWSGGPIRFRHGTTPTGYSLRLGYQLLDATEAAMIRSHYRQQRGALLPFTLAPIIWADHGDTTGPADPAGLWRYASPPEESHRSGGLVDLSITLQSVR